MGALGGSTDVGLRVPSLRTEEGGARYPPWVGPPSQPMAPVKTPLGDGVEAALVSRPRIEPETFMVL